MMRPLSFEQVEALLSKIAELTNENVSLRKQLKGATNALLEQRTT